MTSPGDRDLAKSLITRFLNVLQLHKRTGRGNRDTLPATHITFVFFQLKLDRKAYVEKTMGTKLVTENNY